VDAEGGGGLGKVCCAAQLHPKRQMIANRNVNIWDTIVVDLLAVKKTQEGRLALQTTGYSDGEIRDRRIGEDSIQNFDGTEFPLCATVRFSPQIELWSLRVAPRTRFL
jgi:hypothetical protein